MLKTITTLGHIILGFCLGAALVLYFMVVRKDFERGMNSMLDIVRDNPDFCVQVKPGDKRVK